MTIAFPKAVSEVVRLHQRATLQGALRHASVRERSAGKSVLIWSREHAAFWRAGGAGYTIYVDAAGRYDFDDAFARTQHCDKSKGIVFFAAPKESANV